MSDIDYMKQALVLASKAKGMTSPNPMVGSIIVKDNEMIAAGWHRRCGSDHAEVVALKKAGTKAKGSTLYVTLEPCFHYGKTPPCVNQVISSGIQEVIIAMKDPNPLTCGKSIAKLRKIGIKVKVGVLRKEAEQLNEAFIKYISEGLPFVVSKSAQTLDGKVALSNGQSKWITSEQTRRYARKIRDEFDAILVGSNTVLKDNPQLTGVKKPLIKIILDSTLKIPLKSKVLNDGKMCIVATTSRVDPKKIEALQKKGVEVIVCSEKNNYIHLKPLFKQLAKKKIMSILIEGGATVIGQALKEKLIDKMHVYIAPKIIGSQDALHSIVGLNIKDINKAVTLKNITSKFIGDDIFVEGYLLKEKM